MSSPYKALRDYLAGQALPAEDAPLVDTYSVGLVVPRTGANGAQIAEVVRRLRFAAGVLPEGGTVAVVVPVTQACREGEGLQSEVLNLGRLSKVAVSTLDVAGRQGGAAAEVVRLLTECDEVWCLPDQTHTGHSRALPHAVYALAQSGPRAARYKKIPPWVEPEPAPPKVKPKQKERRYGR